MPLAKQKIYVPLTEGLNTKTDDKFLVPGEVKTLENGVYLKDGRIDKRYGYSHMTQSISTSGSLASAKGIYNYDNELLVEGNDGTTNTNTLYSYSSAKTAWVPKNTFVRTSLSTSEVVHNNAQQTDLQMAFIGSYRLFAWKDSRGGVRYSVMDGDTGTVFVADTEVSSSGDRPQVVAAGSTFFIYYRITGTIRYKSVTTSAITTLSGETTLFNDLNSSNPHFGVVASGTSIYIAYRKSNNHIITSKVSESAPSTVSASDDYTPADIDNYLAVVLTTVSGTDKIHLAWYQTNDTKIHVRILQSSLAAADLADTGFTAGAGAAVILTGCQTSTSSHNVQWFGSTNYGTTYFNNVVIKGVMGTSGVVSAMSSWLYSYTIAIRPFLLNDSVYIGLYYNIPSQASLFIIDTSKNLITKVSPGETGTGQYVTNPSSTIVSGTTAYLAYTRLTETITEGITARTNLGFSIATLDFAPIATSPSVSFGGLKYIASSLLKVYDGVSLFEDGYANYPYAYAPSELGGGDIAAGSYNYVYTYEWLDNKGNLHRSAPSEPVTYQSLGSGESSTQVETLQLTEKELNGRTTVRLVQWRTTNAGSVYYRIASTDNTSGTSPVTFNDGEADATITDNEILYTQGGTLENIQPPACNIIIEHRGHLIIGGLEDGNEIRISKPVSSRLSTGFNEALSIKVDSRDGNVRALGSMDDKVILFKQNSFRYMVGEGPDELGSGQFTTPQSRPSTVGCTNQNSIVTTPEGLMFQSTRGIIYLLTSSLELAPIGEGLYNHYSATISSALNVPTSNEVRFTTTDGDMLVYNYSEKKWSIFTSKACVGSTIWNNKHVLITSAGLPKYEDSTTYLDNNSFVSLKAVTGWIQFDDKLGLQRVYEARVLGNYNTSHKLNVKISYDNDSFVTEDHLLAVSSDPKQYGYRLQHARQKCSSIQYTIYDSAPDSGTGTGQGFSVSGLRILAGVKNKMANTPATRRL